MNHQSCFLKCSYRREHRTDKALLFSLDFPAETRQKDCFRIGTDGNTFRLETDRKRLRFGYWSKPNLAIAVSSHGTHDVVVALSRDGTQSYVLQALTKRKASNALSR